VALVYRDTIKATTVDVGNYTEFESVAVKLTGRHFKASVVVCVYRPPGTVTSTFTDQLSDMVDQIMLLGNRLAVGGDFNVPGDVAGQLDPHAIDVLTQYGLRQHVTGPTHISGITLDLILSRNKQISEQLVSKVAVQSVCFSDHHLLTCRLGLPLPQPVTMTYTYRSLRKIDTTAFSVDILQSRLYDELELDADGYADLFDAEVKRVLDIHAPLRTGRRRCGQHDSRHLSDEARQAKQ